MFEREMLEALAGGRTVPERWPDASVARAARETT
jgi:hypothetical protein